MHTPQTDERRRHRSGVMAAVPLGIFAHVCYTACQRSVSSQRFGMPQHRASGCRAFLVLDGATYVLHCFLARSHRVGRDAAVAEDFPSVVVAQGAGVSNFTCASPIVSSALHRSVFSCMMENTSARGAGGVPAGGQPRRWRGPHRPDDGPSPLYPGSPRGRQGADRIVGRLRGGFVFFGSMRGAFGGKAVVALCAGDFRHPAVVSCQGGGASRRSRLHDLNDSRWPKACLLDGGQR